MFAYERISSELRPRSFGLPLSPTPLEAPTPTPLSISGLQSDGGALETEPRLHRVSRLTAPGGSFASQWIDVDEAVIDDAAGHVAEQPRCPQPLVLRRRQPIVRQLQREEVAVRLR